LAKTDCRTIIVLPRALSNSKIASPAYFFEPYVLRLLKEAKHERQEKTQMRATQTRKGRNLNRKEDHLLFVPAHNEEGEQFSIFERLDEYSYDAAACPQLEDMEDCLGHEERSDSDEDQYDAECQSDADHSNITSLDVAN
jgi:hypothetical protein